MIFSFLFGLCSAVIIFKGKPYHNQYITELLGGKSAMKADLSSIALEDLEFIPPYFIREASPDQWLKLKSLNASEHLCKAAKKAYEERIGNEVMSARKKQTKQEFAKEVEISIDRLGKNVKVLKPPRRRKVSEKTKQLRIILGKMLYLKFNHVPNPYEESLVCRVSGPDICLNRTMKFDELFTWNHFLKMYTCSAEGMADLRARAWTFLSGMGEKSRVVDANRKILLDWALISIVFGSGLSTNSGPQKLVAWLKRVYIFHDQSKVSTADWISLLKRCQQANRTLWMEMRDYALNRAREDPLFADYNPYDDLDDHTETDEESESSVNDLEEFFADAWEQMQTSPWWVPDLNAEMKAITGLRVPEIDALKKIHDRKQRGGYRVPFLLQNHPRITEAFQSDSMVYHGKTMKGYEVMKHIQRQYRALKVPLKSRDRLLVAEWAMISIIFGNGCLPKPQVSYTRWIANIPCDFMSQKVIPLKESIDIMKRARMLSPKLWDALATVAAGRFLADPNLEELPLFEAWCEAKGRALRSVPEILDKVEEDFDEMGTAEILSAFDEIALSLKRDPQQIPHAKIIQSAVRDFTSRLKSNN